MLEPNADYAERLLWAAVIKRAIDDYHTVYTIAYHQLVGNAGQNSDERDTDPVAER